MSDHKTTDYCTRCGESPDSGTHLIGPNAHDYVPPSMFDICACGRSRGAAVHALYARDGHAFEFVPVLEAAVRAALEPQPVRVNSSGRLIAPGALRIKVEDRPGMPQFGVVLGMLLDERGDMLAVVRLDHYGLMLKAYHPSKVTPVTRDEEELHKP